MTGLPDPQRRERVTERGGQLGGIGEVGQQTSTGMPDDTPRISSATIFGRNLGNLRLESALRGGMDKTLSKSYLPRSEGTFTSPTHHP